MMHGWSYYGNRNLQVVPYMAGTPVYVDATYPHLYYETKKEGKIEWVFCGDDLNLGQFIAFFEKRRTMQVLCAVANDKTLIPRGYSWVDNPRGVDGARSVMAGFCFFGGPEEKEARNRERYDLARLAMAYMFEDLKIDVIHGVLLESNERAWKFALATGFEDIAVVPDYHSLRGELVGARVMLCRATSFMPSWEEWKAQQEPIEK